MKGIVYDNEQDAIALTVEIDSLFSFMFEGNTTTYTHVIKHPDRNEWAVILDRDDVARVAIENPEELAGMSKGIEDIVDLDSSWIEELEF